MAEKNPSLRPEIQRIDTVPRKGIHSGGGNVSDIRNTPEGYRSAPSAFSLGRPESSWNDQALPRHCSSRD